MQYLQLTKEIIQKLFLGLPFPANVALPYCSKQSQNKWTPKAGAAVKQWQF